MPLSADDKILLERIESDFAFHAPRNVDSVKYEQMRANGKALASLIIALCPAGRERSAAMTKLEEAIMWANAGIARQSPVAGEPEEK